VLRGRENCQVHYAVLLGADQFFAVKQQYRFFAEVFESEFRHRAFGGDFRRACSAVRDRFLKEDVAKFRPHGAVSE